MNVREEIEKHSAEEHKEILLWLFERNHWQSQWSAVADCVFKGRGPTAPRIWSPSQNGLEQYFVPRMYAVLKRLREEGVWVDVDTGIGPMPELSEAAKEADALFARMEALDFWLSRPRATQEALRARGLAAADRAEAAIARARAWQNEGRTPEDKENE